MKDKEGVDDMSFYSPFPSAGENLHLNKVKRKTNKQKKQPVTSKSFSRISHERHTIVPTSICYGIY